MRAQPDKNRSRAFSYYVREYKLTHAILVNAHKRGINLDSPKKLLAYLLKRKTSRLCDLSRLQEVATGQRSKPRPASPAAASAEETPLDPNAPLKVGLARQVALLEKEVEESHAAYRKETLPFEKLSLQKIYLANVSALRQLAKVQPDADSASGRVLPVDDVDSAWSRSLKEFRSTLEAMPRRIASSPLFKKLDPVDVEELVSKEVTAILTHLETGSWLKDEVKK